MQFLEKSELIEDNMFEEIGDDISVISIVSKKLVKYLSSKSDSIDEIDEDDLNFRVAIDGDEITIVFYYDEDVCEEFESFIEYLREALENNGMDYDDIDEIFDDFEDMINPAEDIVSVKWFCRHFFDKHNLDCVADRFFEEAKEQYMQEEDISEDSSDEVSDDDVMEFISDSNVAYATKTYTYNLNTGEDGISESSFELL